MAKNEQSGNRPMHPAPSSQPDRDDLEQSQLSSVSGKILWWLVRYPLQRVEDFVLALNVSHSTIYRHVMKLLSEGMVEYVTPSLGVKSTCRLYYLSKTGLQAAAVQEHVSASTLARTWGADEEGLLHLLPHVSALVHLQNFLNALILHAPAALAYKGGQRADLNWHWTRNYEYNLHSGDAHLSCTVDAALLLRRANPQPDSAARTEYYSVLVLLDPGLTGPHDHLLIAQKLEWLLLFRDSFKASNGQLFPPVLIVTPTLRQREVWQQKVTEVIASLRTEPLTGAIVVLAPEATPDSAWTLSWQELTTRAPCRLRELFVPQSREALLPGLLLPRSPKTISTPTPERGRILQGNFAQKAEEMSHAPQDYQRKRKAPALLRLCLSQRHLDVLATLYEHPLLATKELAVLLDLQQDSVTRYLYDLRRYCCIETYDLKHETRWQLSTYGLRFIAATHARSLQYLAEYAREEPDTVLIQHGLSQLKKHIKQTANMYTFFCTLLQEVRARRGDHALLWWEIGARCERRYTYHGTQQNLKPAAAFAYQAGDTRLYAWLEWYEDTMNQEYIAHSLQAYARYMRTREWAAAGLQAPPMLFIVLSEKDHYQRLLQVATEDLVGVGLIVRATPAPSITRHGPLAAIWSQIAPALPPGVENKRQTLVDLSVPRAGASKFASPRVSQ